ncbi:beta strand repeat-containing protein, partial [Maribacter hydrothermalis]
ANNNYSTGAHTTDAADLTSGVLADSRVQESNVTQHQAALTITESQISDLAHTVDTNTQLSEAEVDAFVANNNYSTGAHTTDATDLTSGVLDDARVQESNVTQHQTALTITESQISDLTHTVDTNTQLSEAEVDAFVANNNYSTGAHTTDAADLTSGVLDNARVQESNVTQHQSALTITEWQISDLTHTVDTNTQLSEAEVDAFVANNNYSTGAHTTDAADLTSGVLDDARVQESNVTQHQTALTITESQISDLTHTVDTNTQLSEAEVDAFVANNNYSTGAHTTDAADLTSGVLDDARVQESNITQHEAALTITESQISDLTHTVDTNTQLSEAEVDAFVANNNYSTGAHTTDAADLTSGVLDDARVQESNITQHEAALTITESQISDLTHTVDTNTQLSEAEVDAFVANNNYSTGAHTTDTDTQYTAGTGLTLSATIFSVNNLAGDVTGPINATIIADGAIIGGAGGKIADNSITASDLAPNSVNASEINSNAVGTSELQVDAVETENLLNGNVTPIKIQPGSINQVLTTNSSGSVVWENKSADITTNLTQNTTTGLITYTNEISANQTANTVGTETNNNISVGANGGAFYISPIKAIGKISSTGTVTKATSGVSVIRISVGYYRVTLPTGAVSDANYIIQLTQPGRGGAGNDDPGISYSNQTATSFEVIIGDNDNGGTDRSRFDSEFMFTVLDL